MVIPYTAVCQIWKSPTICVQLVGMLYWIIWLTDVLRVRKIVSDNFHDLCTGYLADTSVPSLTSRWLSCFVNIIVPLQLRSYPDVFNLPPS